MVHIVEHSNLLEINSGIICHQVNCVGIMGAGIALQIRNKWPIVFHNYQEECNIFTSNPSKLMGHVQDTLVSDNLVVANCFGQVFPGRNKVMTDYKSWDIILDKLNDISNFYSLDLHFPWMIGCGLAGGDWNVILGKIENKFGSHNSNVHIHKLN